MPVARILLILVSAVSFLTTIKSLLDGKGSDTGLWRRDNAPFSYWISVIGAFFTSALLLFLAVAYVR